LRVLLCMRWWVHAPGLLRTKLNRATVCTDQSGTRQIANTNYGVFVRAGLGYCSITWSRVSGDVYTFTVSGDTDVLPTDLLGKFIYIGILLCSHSGVASFSLCGSGFMWHLLWHWAGSFQALQFPPASCHSTIVPNYCKLHNGISTVQPTSQTSHSIILMLFYDIN
jgi:hypothetical protein